MIFWNTFVDSAFFTPFSSSISLLPNHTESSPHLINVEERIRINGKPIDRQLFADLFWFIHDKIIRYTVSEFVSIRYFGSAHLLDLISLRASSPLCFKRRSLWLTYFFGVSLAGLVKDIHCIEVNHARSPEVSHSRYWMVPFLPSFGPNFTAVAIGLVSCFYYYSWLCLPLTREIPVIAPVQY